MKTALSTSRGKRSLTMADVGRHAGVSPITVSRALGNHPAVTAKTRAAVRRSVAELGYVRDFTASALSRRGSKVITLLVPSVSHSVFAETIQGLSEALSEQGFALTIAHSGYSALREEELVRSLLGYKPDGIVLTGFTHTRNTRALLRTQGLPVVETWNLGPKPIDMAAGFSNEQSALEMTRYLISRGHTRIAYHGGTQTDNDRTRAREAGFRVALLEAGLSAVDGWIRSAPMELGSGAELAREVKASRRGRYRPQGDLRRERRHRGGIRARSDAYRLAGSWRRRDCRLRRYGAWTGPDPGAHERPCTPARDRSSGSRSAIEEAARRADRDRRGRCRVFNCDAGKRLTRGSDQVPGDGNEP
ncbi:MAG: LacI family DNA-binding transcriptional regulator [Gemmatimonadaceae bacterium]|nr:LacI family DNA-binding transcriptional regulator [Gemmatimonadaceae bacterium]